MISSLSHISVVRSLNPDLDFMIAPVLVADDYTGVCLVDEFTVLLVSKDSYAALTNSCD